MQKLTFSRSWKDRNQILSSAKIYRKLSNFYGITETMKLCDKAWYVHCINYIGYLRVAFNFRLFLTSCSLSHSIAFIDQKNILLLYAWQIFVSKWYQHIYICIYVCIYDIQICVLVCVHCLASCLCAYWATAQHEKWQIYMYVTYIETIWVDSSAIRVAYNWTTEDAIFSGRWYGYAHWHSRRE